jgi:HAD superfamily hydrolase (TIGR01509 family)
MRPDVPATAAPPNGIAALIFDMDGLMMDTEPGYRAAWQRAAGEQGCPIDDARYLAFVGRTNPDAERMLEEIFGAAFNASAFRTRWMALWRADVEAHGIPVKPGLAALLDFADQRGIRKVVATSSAQRETALILRELVHRFDAVVTGDDVTRGKPAPDIFLAAAARVGVAPARCLVLEDSEAGVQAGAAAGMRVIMVPDLKQPSDEAKKLAARVCGSLDEVMAFMVRGS